MRDARVGSGTVRAAAVGVAVLAAAACSDRVTAPAGDGADVAKSGGQPAAASRQTSDSAAAGDSVAVDTAGAIPMTTMPRWGDKCPPWMLQPSPECVAGDDPTSPTLPGTGDTMEGDDGELESCENPNTPIEDAFCMRSRLTLAQRQAVEDAVNAMDARGGCSALADSVRKNLQDGTVFSYPNTKTNKAGFGEDPVDAPPSLDGVDLPHGTILVKERYLDNPNANVPPSLGATGPNVLEYILAHEADHRNGFDHRLDAPQKPDAWSPNSKQCGNVTIP